MTITSYNRLKEALMQQRREVTASPRAASRFIDELGLRDIVVSNNKKAEEIKAVTRKTTPKKTAGK